MMSDALANARVRRRLEQYLPRLDALVCSVGGAPPPELARQLAFSWTSPLSDRPDQFHTAEGLFVEQCMVRRTRIALRHGI